MSSGCALKRGFLASWGSSVLQSCIVLAGVFTAVLVSLVSSTSLTALPGATGVEVRGRAQEVFEERDDDEDDDDEDDDADAVGESAGEKVSNLHLPVGASAPEAWVGSSGRSRGSAPLVAPGVASAWWCGEAS